MAKIQAVTVADIARKAGVCPATVSLSLRNSTSISPATRDRIVAWANRLGYRPHPAVSTLMANIRARRPTRFRPTIAGITTWLGAPADRDPTRQRFFDGAVSRARDLGYVMEEFWAYTPGVSLQRLDGILRARGIEGLLIFPLEKPIPLPFAWKRFASATIGYTFDQAALHRAIPAYFDNVVIALRELQRRGYRRIGLVNTPALSARLLRMWLGAFYAWQSEAGPGSPGAILEVGLQEKSRFHDWLKRYRPDAIIFGGVPVYDWLCELGCAIPGDLGLVSLCVAGTTPGVEFARVLEKPEVVGAAAVDLIVEQLQRNEFGLPADPKEVFITGAWEDGATVRAVTTPAAAGRPAST